MKVVEGEVDVDLVWVGLLMVGVKFFDVDFVGLFIEII